MASQYAVSWSKSLPCDEDEEDEDEEEEDLRSCRAALAGAHLASTSASAALTSSVRGIISGDVVDSILRRCALDSFNTSLRGP